MNGAHLYASSTDMPIYAPSTHPLPVIEASLQPLSLSSSQTVNFPATWSYKPSPIAKLGRGTILLKPLRTGLEGLERFARVGGMIPRNVGMWALADTDRKWRSGSFELVASPHRNANALAMPPSWSKSLDVLEKVSENNARDIRIVVQGAKRAGKSTFAKMLVNRLLKQ